jgi:hypothetical protein
MATKVSIDGLSEAIAKELEAYDKSVNEGIRKAVDRSMRQLVQETKGTAPVGHRHKHYRDSITSKVTNTSLRAYEKTWYVKGSDYRLSHLLNNGHMLRNGDRYPGTGFITKASVSVLHDFEEAIKEVCANGS